MKKIIYHNSVPVKISKKNTPFSFQNEQIHNLLNAGIPVNLGGTLEIDVNVALPAHSHRAWAGIATSPINNMGVTKDNQVITDSEQIIDFALFDWEFLFHADYQAINCFDSSVGVLSAAGISYENSKTEIDLLDQYEFQNDFDDGTEKIVMVTKGKKGGHEVLRIPQANGQVDSRVGFVDQCSFTVRVHEVLSRSLEYPYSSLGGMKWTENDIVPRLSTILIDIFGFAATHQRERGVNFYKISWVLGEGDGILSSGGQNDTINVQITGQGAQKAKDGWEVRLYKYLKKVDGWLSRCDLAADMYSGQYTPEKAEKDFLSGGMSLTNARLFGERRGDWYNVEGGKTFYVGKRKSGKLLRVYEKGLQLLGSICNKNMGDNDRLIELKKWVRVECEWHNQCRVLPIEMLINPGQYLAGAYPALSFLSENQSRIETIKKSAVIAVERAVQIVKHQFGPTIYSLLEIYDVSELIPMIIRVKVAKFSKPFAKLLPVDAPENESFGRVLASIPF